VRRCFTIEAEAVAKSYGAQQILSGASFFVDTGQIAAIAGKNGSGKSTLLAIAAATLKPDGGRVLLGGEDPFKSPGLRKRIGYVAQGDCLFEELTVRDNLTFWAAAADIPGSGALRSPYISLLGLEPFLRKRVSRLSGGMRRRAAVCASLLSDPDYLLLDEPFAGLDLLYRQELATCLLKLRNMGKTLLYTTHSPEELIQLSDITFLLAHGKIISCQNTKDLIRQGVDIQQLLISLIKGESKLL